MKAKCNTKDNVTYELKDKAGNLKKLFQENWIYKVFLKYNVRLPRIPILCGNWVFTKKVANLVTNAGKAGVAGLIVGDGSIAVFDYIAIGTGTSAAAVTDTALEAEITTGGGERVQGTASRITTDVTNDTAKVTTEFTFSDTFAVTESGLLNAGAAGILAARQVFASINVVATDQLTITWNIDVD